MYKSSDAVPKQAGNRKGSPLRSGKSSEVVDDGGVRQWREQRVANYEFLKQKREWKRELRKRKGSRSRSSSESLISVGERIRFQGEGSQAYSRRMKTLDEPQKAGTGVRLTEGVKCEEQTAAVVLGVKATEQCPVASVVVRQDRVVLDSDDAWAIARQVREEEPWLRCEEEKGRRKFIVQRKWYEPGWMLCLD
jgi:hypothetical protein